MTVAFTNPVYGDNFADPQVVAVDGSYYAFATNGPLGNVQTLKSADLVSWDQVGDALPELPAWTSPGRVWAPEVAVHGPDRFVMYYTSSDTASGRQAIGVGVASEAKGPYVDKSSRPLICEAEEGGSIDASPFQDSSGQRWLYWKNDGNAIGVDTWISVSRLSADGLRLIGEPTRLIKQTLPWEGTLVEAPYMVERDSAFHLFYSANAFDKASYAVGHARCDTPAGPCTKSGDPILTSSPDAAGPGHNMVLRTADRWWFVYHAWDPASVGTDPHGRTMWLSELTWSGQTPHVQPPLKNNPVTPW
ncbi:glycosyl hydrolase family 43 [Kribbella voronezhensis]|uniref:Glycosyl hydrolase family 43 n=1 Tax=Kribbella voronezhensis TaxID=2512212 RepID=A0A4V3FKE0_9ACTN|nr:glycoside hydrolase family 43 protein [Kribbella voronezhensis]TDU89813.1 glycosyl hydrolase family 43 [Kribbella voronezhensis]